MLNFSYTRTLLGPGPGGHGLELGLGLGLSGLDHINGNSGRLVELDA